MDNIIFACVHSAGRSQMAAAFFNRLADPSLAAAASAGTEPAAQVHPEVVASMQEIGIDLRNAKPQRLTPELAADATWLVTMGCGEACPVVPGVKREDWPLPDPKGKGADAVRAIRDDVRTRVRAFVERERYSGVTIEPAGPDAVPAIVAFLAANRLPDAGLAEHATELLLARRGDVMVGTAALEVYGREALLRSVAVDSSLRGAGIGQRLTRVALDRAKQRGVSRVFLLTETAAGFFPKFGFTGIERAQAPEAIRGTVEFASACPTSARVMVVELT